MESIAVTDRAGKSFMLAPGAEFDAAGADGSRQRFQYLGIMPFEDGCDYYLASVTNGSFLNVASSWFSRFEIAL